MTRATRNKKPRTLKVKILHLKLIRNRNKVFVEPVRQGFYGTKSFVIDSSKTLVSVHSVEYSYIDSYANAVQWPYDSLGGNRVFSVFLPGTYDQRQIAKTGFLRKGEYPTMNCNNVAEAKRAFADIKEALQKMKVRPKNKNGYKGRYDY